jgi:acyl-ACP thioesterase
VNNTVYWQAVEHVLHGAGLELRRPLRARLDFREPLDLGDRLELAVTGDERNLDLGFVVGGHIKAVAAIETTPFDDRSAKLL